MLGSRASAGQAAGRRRSARQNAMHDSGERPSTGSGRPEALEGRRADRVPRQARDALSESKGGQRARSRAPSVLTALVLVAAAITAAWGITSRERAMTALSQETHQLAIPTIAVTKPSRGAADEEISLPGN